MTRFQGRGKTVRPICPNCGDHEILVSAYIKTGNWYEGKQRWLKVGHYCKVCHYFLAQETELDKERQKLVASLGCK
jgi:predicted RNA-binding Zn-ribbon protein involved in translation (DUF1610 family)